MVRHEGSIPFLASFYTSRIRYIFATLPGMSTSHHTNTLKLFRYPLILGFLVSLGTVAYEFLEGWNFIDAFYFSIVTLATVGYGDHYPVTTIGKLFTTVYIMVGVTTFLLWISELSRYLHNEKL